MKQLLDFLNESKGQRISLRGKNKPYNPKEDELVQKRDSRSSRAEKLRNDRHYAKIASDFEKFKQALINIYDAKNEILSDNYIDRIYLVFYDDWEKDYYNIYISEPNPLGDVEILKNKKIDVNKLYCTQKSNFAKITYNNDLYSCCEYSVDNSEHDSNGEYTISIRTDNFFEKTLFIGVDYNATAKNDNGEIVDTKRFVSSLVKRITKRNSLSWAGRYFINAQTLIDNPDLFMKAYREIKERF